jgi:hypothetical protein
VNMNFHENYMQQLIEEDIGEENNQ